MDGGEETAEMEKLEIVRLVRRFGGSNADAVLDPTMQVFRYPGIDGFIGYRLIRGCAIVYGDPICPLGEKERLAAHFLEFAKSLRKEVVYIVVSKEFAFSSIQRTSEALIEFGKELIFNPPSDPKKHTGDRGSLVRRKVKQALKEGASVHEYMGNDSQIEHQIEEVGSLWLKSRRGPQLHISNVYLFQNRLGKRWFYAKKEDKVIGVITLNQLESEKGWLINHLMVLPEAPNGTSEFLVATVLEILEKEGCPFATLGSVPAFELGEIVGINKFSILFARSVFKTAKKIVHIEGLSLFWGKFLPNERPSYLLFSRKRIRLKEVYSLMRALSGKS